MRLKINYPYIILGLFLIEIIVYAAYWMLLIFGIIYLLPIVLFRVTNNRFIKLLYYTVLAISILSTAILARLFFFELYNIPSNSMTNSLVLSDKVFVSKLHYGPKPPESPFEIPWINILFYMNVEARERMDEKWWKTKRLPGLQEVKRGEIFVFKSPWEGSEFFIKRCVATPGDTFNIKQDQLYINEKLTNFSNFIQSSKPTYTWSDSNFTANKIYPWVLEEPWTLSDFGPLYIPKAGDSIPLNQQNWILYRTIIKKYEPVKIKKVDDHFYQQGKEVYYYQFSNNYYFVMGDNRYNFMDSRYWELLPEDKIVGKAGIDFDQYPKWKSGLEQDV